MGIAESLSDAIAYLAEHPDEARYTDSIATASVGPSLRVDVVGPNGESLTTDMPRGVGGRGESPSPGWLLRAAVAACDATLIAMRAAQEGVELTHLEVTVDSESDDRGILGIDGTVPAGPLSLHVRVRLAGDASDEQLAAIVVWGVAHCPVHDAVTRAVTATVEVEPA